MLPKNFAYQVSSFILLQIALVDPVHAKTLHFCSSDYGFNAFNAIVTAVRLHWWSEDKYLNMMCAMLSNYSRRLYILLIGVLCSSAAGTISESRATNVSRLPLPLTKRSTGIRGTQTSSGEDLPEGSRNMTQTVRDQRWQ